ncbi:FAD-binding oxidoreductase, partial [Rhodoflexus caldus]|uniref:FAD-binding oxidoreductase n=1 Tax=Rhodoflexus caldus TaxID=2891236 RepID=UPI002029CBAB
MINTFEQLKKQLQGELHTDRAMRILYATDASAYREMPQAVALPRTVDDLKRLIRFADTFGMSLIPRTAGTSLAGQVVGNGIVVDFSKYFDKILEINTVEHWVRVQPGVIRDDLNLFLKPHGLFFGPETSTANRAMIGGMIGNNSCGLHSIVYGSTRDHLLEVRALLADGNEAVFKAISEQEFADKCNGIGTVSPLEQRIYLKIRDLLSNEVNRDEIRRQFPNPRVTRRNTGYALDAMLDAQPFNPQGLPLNFCRLLAGSEGTLALITEAKLNLVPVPLPHVGLLCAHFQSINDSLRANIIAMRHCPEASELVDDYILELTKTNPEQQQNRFFVQGSPKAILMVEFTAESRAEIEAKAARLVADFQANNLGYAFPLLHGEDTKKAWNLRKAGLGIMYNIAGDAKPVNLIEDCAVAVEDLPDYIAELDALARSKGIQLEYSAHAGAGELHPLPLMNLKTAEGQRLFRELLADTVQLVKKYNGSLSGEHGDGRLRGEFIAQMVGQRCYEMFREVKQTWDPKGIFNPGKIVDTPPMNEFLRYQPNQQTLDYHTVLDFGASGGILRHAEQCNGSGDCRKSHLSGGTMCPSYMATRSEK